MGTTQHGWDIRNNLGRCQKKKREFSGAAAREGRPIQREPQTGWHHEFWSLDHLYLSRLKTAFAPDPEQSMGHGAPLQRTREHLCHGVACPHSPCVTNRQCGCCWPNLAKVGSSSEKSWDWTAVLDSQRGGSGFSPLTSLPKYSQGP